MEIRSKVWLASIVISVICMIDSYGEITGIIQKTLSKWVFLYSFNVILGELLEHKEYEKHESEASHVLDLISIEISQILSSSNFDTLTAKFYEGTNCRMFFHVILFMFVYNKNKDMPFCIGSIDRCRYRYSYRQI